MEEHERRVRVGQEKVLVVHPLEQLFCFFEAQDWLLLAFLSLNIISDLLMRMVSLICFPIWMKKYLHLVVCVWTWSSLAYNQRNASSISSCCSSYQIAHLHPVSTAFNHASRTQNWTPPPKMCFHHLKLIHCYWNQILHSCSLSLCCSI